MNAGLCSKILTIDDDDCIRQSIKDHLEDLGFEVIEAENGEIGLALFRKEKPNLILVDLRMPKVGGLEVLETVIQESPETPIIVISGMGLLEDAIHALHLGAWDYVVKPIQDMNIVNHAIERSLERARLRSESSMYQHKLEAEVARQTQDLKQANEELKKEIAIRKRAEQESQLLAQVVEQAAEAILISGSNGIIRYVNSAFEEISGLSQAEVIDTHFETFLKNPDKQEVYEDLISTLQKDKVWRGRLINKKKDGTAFHLDMTVFSVYDDVAPVSNFVAIGHDVSDTVSLARQLRQAQKMEAIGTLAGGIAHDFNNILAIIIGQTELMELFNVQSDTPLYQRLEEIRKAGYRAKDLVSQILTFSRQSEHPRKPVKIAPLLKETVQFLRASIPTTVEIRSDVYDNSLMIHADPTQIQQVLMNLCANAAHAMKNTGGLLSICLKSVHLDQNAAENFLKMSAGDYIELSVSDNGPGISSTVKERIFEPYFTTKKEDEGTGLGLAIVHGIVNNHGGSISVSSQPGAGSHFHILLPQYQSTDQQENNDKQKEIRGEQERILLVDDEPALLAVTEELISQLGYQVISETNSEVALKIFTESPFYFDLVFADLTMPKLTGIELSEKIHAIRSDIPIILCSGYRQTFELDDLRQFGIMSFIKKPFNIPELSQTIRNILHPDFENKT